MSPWWHWLWGKKYRLHEWSTKESEETDLMCWPKTIITISRAINAWPPEYWVCIQVWLVLFSDFIPHSSAHYISSFLACHKHTNKLILKHAYAINNKTLVKVVYVTSAKYIKVGFLRGWCTLYCPTPSVKMKQQQKRGFFVLKLDCNSLFYKVTFCLFGCLVGHVPTHYPGIYAVELPAPQRLQIYCVGERY